MGAAVQRVLSGHLGRHARHLGPGMLAGDGVGGHPRHRVDFARILLPETIRDRPLGKPRNEGNLRVYHAAEGYRVVLRELDPSVTEESVIEIEVQSPLWNGEPC